MSKKLQKYWYQQGVKAGKTEGWMNLEETLEEDHERWPNVKDPVELVQRGIDGWEETDHFQLIYRAKMMGDAEIGSPPGVIIGDATFEKYWEYRTEFWEGYLTGRKSIGRDIYAIAKRLLTGKGQRKSRVLPSMKRKVKALGAIQGVR